MHYHFVQSLEVLQGGGLGSSVQELSKQMNVKGFQSKIVTTHEIKELNTGSVIQMVRSFPKSFFYSSGLKDALEEEFNRNKSAIIHSHGFYFYPLYLAGFFALKINNPLIYHVHGMFEPYTLGRSKLKKKIIGSLYENKFKRNASLFRALTSIEADQIRKQGFKNIEIIPNGLDLKVWEADDYQYKNDKPYFLFLSRIHPKKGLINLLKAWSLLPVNSRENYDLLVAGPDENGHLSEVLKYIEEKNLKKSVKYIGIHSGTSKIELFKGALAYILTSYSEGLPMTCIEGMAAKKPLIITPGCNLTEEVRNFGAGWIVNTEPPEIKEAILEVINLNIDDLNKIGRGSWKLVNQKYSWDKILPIYKELENRLI